MTTIKIKGVFVLTLNMLIKTRTWKDKNKTIFYNNNNNKFIRITKVKSDERSCHSTVSGGKRQKKGWCDAAMVYLYACSKFFFF